MSKLIVAWAAIVAGLALFVAGCGSSTSPPTGGPATAAIATDPAEPALSAQPAPSPTATATAAPTPAPIVVAAAPLEPALKQLWQTGGPKPPRDGACCITVAPDGKLWASSEWDASFWIIDPDGKHLESWGTAGKGDGQFNFVAGTGGYGAVAFDPDGTFYVADAGNHRIQKFGKDRSFIKAWGSFGDGEGELASPMDVASDGRGHVYVVDNDRRDVQQFSSDGAYLKTLVKDLTNQFIDIDAAGRLYVDNGTTILVFDADGTQLPGFDLSATGAKASGMAFDAEGNLFVATVSSYFTPIETKAIYMIDAGGKVLHAWPGEADSIALDPEGGALYSSFYADPFIRKLELPKP